jgi:hypothetical protein
MTLSRTSLAVIGLLISSPPVMAQAAQSFNGDYTVSFLGFTVARANFASTIGAGTFSLQGTLESAGFGRFFDDTKGTINSTGGFAGNRTSPSRFRVDYVQKDKPTVTTIDFADGAVTKTETIPAPKPKGENWVPVAPADLSQVSDPIAATLVRADTPEAVCGRTVRVFDGEFRLDLALRPVGVGTASIEGYEGQTVTCRATAKPVSGFRKGRRALEFLEKQSRIMITFAPLGTTGVYAPIQATVGTQIGTVSIKARRFGATE